MSPDEVLKIIQAQFSDIKEEEVPDGEFRDPEWPVMMVPAQDVPRVFDFLKSDEKLGFDFLKNLTAIDFQDRIQIIYHLYSVTHKHKLLAKVDLDRDAPEINSVSLVWATADWQEREVFDLFGVQFNNHSDLRRIMLPEDWDGYPLRKDYVHEPDHYD